MAWGKEWPTWPVSQQDKTTIIYSGPNMFPEINAAKLFVDCKDTKEEYNNKVPTHDPYTNPGAMIYYECSCGAILDPKTKSFAALNNAASVAGWKVRWKQSGEGYQPFCVECGEDVE